MPIGIIINVLSVAIGGLLGSVLGTKIKENIKQQMNRIFGVCALGMGIASIIHMENMPAVVFSIILGTFIGLLLNLGTNIEQLAKISLKRISKEEQNTETEQLLLTAIILFCASGTGIYGSLDSGMTGNHTILISKSILDFFTAMIFACQLGKVVSGIAIPQTVIMLILFAGAKIIYPMTDASMIADFKACGGFILLATGIRMIKLRDLSIADMIPAMILVMPVSYVWSHMILPFIG